MSTGVSKAVLLVGGKGTRLRPLTYERPKALVPLLNEPLLAYEFKLLARHGLTDIILAMGYKAQAVERALGDGSRWGVNLTYVQEERPLDTAGAIKNVQEHIDGHFVAMNGDLVYDVDLSAAIDAHLGANAAVTFCLRKVEDISRFGLIQTDDRGHVTAFKEKQRVDPTGRNNVNSGTYIMSPQILASIPQDQPFSNETDLFPNLLAAGRTLLGYLPERQGYWADVGTIESYRQTTFDLLAGAIPWVDGGIAQGADVHERAQVHHPVAVASDVLIASGARIGPNVTIAADCTIGRNARIQDTILWEDVRVADNCSLRDCIATTGAKIHERSRISQQVITDER